MRATCKRTLFVHGSSTDVHRQAMGWVVQALIVAAALPDRPCDLDVIRCTIFPLAEPASTPDRREGGSVVLMPNLAVSAPGIEVQPAQFRIKAARHFVETTVEEADFDRALDVARSRFALAAAVFALASSPEWGPAYTLHRVRPIEEENGWIPIPVSSKIGGLPVGPIDDAGMKRIASLLALLQDDPPAKQLLDLWYSATEYECRAFDLVDLEHILVRYVKVIERVAMAMASELRDEVDPDAEAHAIERELERLQVALQSKKGATNKAGIVQSVAQAINGIRLSTIGHQLGAAAEALELDEGTKAAQRRAWTARSTKGGHAPDAPSEITLDELLDARQAAGTYLIQYLVWRSKKLLGQ